MFSELFSVSILPREPERACSHSLASMRRIGLNQASRLGLAPSFKHGDDDFFFAHRLF